MILLRRGFLVQSKEQRPNPSSEHLQLESELGLGFTFLQFSTSKHVCLTVVHLLLDQILSRISWALQPSLSSPTERPLKPNLENSCAIWQMTSDLNQQSSSAYLLEENMGKDNTDRDARLCDALGTT